MGHDYDIEEKMQRTHHFTSEMMYDKTYNNISNIIPGSMSKNVPLGKKHVWNEV